jgi:hypothetical protein
MKVERVFRDLPPDQLILRILNAVGVVSFQDIHWWPYTNLYVPTVTQTLDSCIEELKQYYMPHKLNILTRKMTPRRYLTIIRHCVRAKNMNLEGHEVHSSKLTYAQRMLYRVTNALPQLEDKNPIFTVTFD